MKEEKTLKIAIGSDHGGFHLKEDLIEHLKKREYDIINCGPFEEITVDYPLFAGIVAENVSTGKADFGIMVDGVGIGSAMVANKYKNVRAAPAYSVFAAISAREHNDANILTLGGGMIGTTLAKNIVDEFLSHKCTVERHKKRVSMINELDKKYIQTYINSNIDDSVLKEEAMADISEKDITLIAERVKEIISSSENTVIKSEANENNSEMICQCGIHIEKKPETIRKFMEFGVERIGYNNASGGECVPQDIAKCIDHTLLRPDATEEDIKRMCKEAREYNFASVCISPSYVTLTAKELNGSDVKVCTVIGFPSGAHIPEIKSMEARRAIRDGAKEIDMVINIGALKSHNDELVYRDIRMVCEACEDGSALSKVIIEAALLTNEEKIRACLLAKKAKADYVKTSTGFGPHGATAEDVALMSSVVREAGISVKAAGGIRTFEDAKAMIEAGASRIGASAGIKIVKAAKNVV